MLGFNVTVLVTAIVIIWYLIGSYFVDCHNEYVFARLDGNGPTQMARRALTIAKTKPRKRALDYYQLGVLQDYHMGDQVEAGRNYARALAMIPNEPEDARFIIDRVGDRLHRHPAEFDEFHHQLPALVALQQQWDAVQRPPVPVGQKWTVDTQNVHDSYLSDTVANQYQLLKQINGGNLSSDNIHNIQRIIRDQCPVTKPEDAAEIEAAVQMLARIRDQNAEITKLGGDRETALISQVWTRMNDTPDKIRSFVTGLNNAWNGGQSVCATGRVSNIIASMAHMDDSLPELGLLKTREVLRNEIMHAASEVLNRELERDQDAMQIYMKDAPEGEVETAKLAELRARVMEAQGVIVEGYKDMPADERQKIKQEVEAASFPSS